MSFDDERLVDALEEGKIVKVSEEYAKKEGLMILRKHSPKNYLDREKGSGESSRASASESRSYQKGILNFEELRKPLDWRKDQIVQELVEDFHWVISKARRERNITRKQFANAIRESEETVKRVENGIMPTHDFVLVNKIQDYLGINLRKDGQNFSQSARMQLESEKKKQRIEEKEALKDIEISREEAFAGKDIDILGEEPGQ